MTLVDVGGSIDGRTARANRTRAAVVDALLALLEEGDLRPPAPRIAERAGVSPRSIFQHFTDREALFAAVARAQLDRMRANAHPIPLDGDLSKRLAAFVHQRARVLEALTPVRRAALLYEPFSPQLQAARRTASDLGRAEVARVFGPELRAHRGAARARLLDATDAAAGWTAWDRLRSDAGLDPEAAASAMTRTIAALLGGGAA